MKTQIINIGILAHADAGKTTVTENVLYLSGAIKQKGSVDKGSCHTDFLAVEKERGISVRSAVTSCFWNNCRINIIDTPGHVDFSAEVDRILRVLDCAILVISAVDGVQAQTKNIFDALSELNIPTIIFINKIDRIGADTELVINEIKKELIKNIFPVFEIENEQTENEQIKNIFTENNISSKLIEKLADFDENILEKFLSEEKIPFSELSESLKIGIKNNKTVPVIFGSGKTQAGISELLDFIVDFAPKANTSGNDDFSALVFRIDHDKLLGKVAGIRIFGGKIKIRETFFNNSLNSEQKVAQLKEYRGNKFVDIEEAVSGNIVALTGIPNIKVGDILGKNSGIKEIVRINNPLLTVKVLPENPNNFCNLADALHELSQEDPALDFVHDKEEQELNIKIIGKIQIEILERILLDRFGLTAKFENPTVIYKETPKRAGEGFVRYWMPKPCWAIMKFKIEPGERGSGVVYKSELTVNQVLQKYQNEVERTIPLALKQGIKGWEVTDIKITLIEGEDHNVHTRPGDFVVATPMGIMNGLINTDTAFLEPIISFKIKAQEHLLGQIASDITKMRGTFESPDISEDYFEMRGTLPVSTSVDYPVTLSSISGGKAKITTKFAGYQICADEFGITRPYKGISPLDEAKYILKARKAIQ